MYVCMGLGIGLLALRTDTLFTPAPLKGPEFLSIYAWVESPIGMQEYCCNVYVNSPFMDERVVVKINLL
jgi:hypothetical protein